MPSEPPLAGPYQLHFPSSSRLRLAPFPVQAGFPSPAEDYMVEEIDLNQLFLTPRESSFGFRVQGESMIEAGIHPGDVLIVNTEVERRPGEVVVATINNEWVVKKLGFFENRLSLLPCNPHYAPVVVHDFDDVKIFGVAIISIHPFRKWL